MSRRSKLYSIFRYKCPFCHEGEFFADRNPYNFSRMGQVLPECPVCHRRFEREPGFFYGSLYVGYALGVAMFVTAFVATWVIYPEASSGLYVTVILASLVLFGPWLYALSKTIWANLFYHYMGVERTAEEKERQVR